MKSECGRKINDLKEIISILSIDNTTIDHSKLNGYKRLIKLILIVHIVGLLLIIPIVWFVSNYIEYIVPYINLFASLSVFITFMLGLIIFITSLKSEMISSQAYEQSINRAGSTVLSFNDFLGHLNWLNQNLSPENFESKKVNLSFAISTPVYGIAADHKFKLADDQKSLIPISEEEIVYSKVRPYESFLSYLSKWVSHFESIIIDANPPTWQLAIWNINDHHKVFCQENVMLSPRINKKNLEAVSKYKELLHRIVNLHKNGKIALELYYTEQCSTRLFLASTDKQFKGLMTIFTPLSPSALCYNGWNLIGVDVRDQNGFQGLLKYWRKLIVINHADPVVSNNCVGDLRDPDEFLRRHFKLDKAP